MTDKKDVHILVPRGFQNRRLVKGEAANLEDGKTAARGDCMECRGTGAIVLNVMLLNPHVVDGRIVSCKPAPQVVRCRCYKGQFWRNWHPANFVAIILPKWEKEIKEFVEREKSRIIRESGGNYEPGADTFLDDLNLSKRKKKKEVLSLDDCVREMLAKKGDFII